MNGIMDKLNIIPLRKLIWVLPIVFAIHELEEWDIIHWYQAYIVNQPEMTYSILWTQLAFTSFLGFAWTFIASLFPKITVSFLLVFL